jgi:two-component system, chemotaxis family, chemotaxis protein CheY
MPEILVIDDDEFMLSTLQEVLLSAGFGVTTTADGPQGIELYARVKPAAVVLDLGLPSMDGLQVLKRIREIDADAKVLVVTGYPSEAAALTARSMGANNFLPKPFDANQLVETLNAVLHASS